MKLPRAIGIACLAGLVSICLVVFGGTLWNREPTYHTKPFSYWLDQIPCTVTMPSGFVSRMYPQGYKTAAELEAHAQQDRDRANEGLQAVTAIGDKCLPMLLRSNNFSRREPRTHRQNNLWALRLEICGNSKSSNTDSFAGSTAAPVGDQPDWLRRSAKGCN